MGRNECLAIHAWLIATVIAGVMTVGGRLTAAREAGSERGNITTQQVIWIAVGSVLAIGAAAVIVALVMSKVNGIDLDTPTP